MTNELTPETLSINMELQMMEMSWSSALIEWESAGLDDVPTDNLFKMQEVLSEEINKRQKKNMYFN